MSSGSRITSGKSALVASPPSSKPLELPLKARRALFYKAALAALPVALPRPLKTRIAKVQAKIQGYLTQPRAIVLDQQTLIQSIPLAWKNEYADCERLVKAVMLAELDPENANGEAWRDARLERDVQALERLAEAA